MIKTTAIVRLYTCNNATIRVIMAAWLLLYVRYLTASYTLFGSFIHVIIGAANCMDYSHDVWDFSMLSNGELRKPLWITETVQYTCNLLNDVMWKILLIKYYFDLSHCVLHFAFKLFFKISFHLFVASSSRKGNLWSTHWAKSVSFLMLNWVSLY